MVNKKRSPGIFVTNLLVDWLLLTRDVLINRLDLPPMAFGE
jgi:hypothetical protein